MVVEPESGVILSPLERRAGVTRGPLGLSARGSEQTTVRQAGSDSSGTTFSISIRGTNGLESFAKMFGAALGDIGVDLKLKVSKTGDVSGAGASKGFPSLEIVKYEIIQGELVTTLLFSQREGNKKELKKEKPDKEFSFPPR